MVLLLAPSAWAGDPPDTPVKDPKKERAALVTAACGPGAPVLLLRRPRRPGGDQPEGATEPPDMLDSGEGCDDRVAALPGDTEVALRPEGAMTPDAVTRAFTGARKLDNLAATLTQASDKLKNPDVTTTSILDRLFDNAAGRTARTEDPTKALRKTLTDTLAVSANPTAEVRPLAVTPPVKKGPVVSNVPGPNAANWTPEPGTGDLAPILNPNQPYTDGKGLWPFPSRTELPASAIPPQNPNGVHSPGGHQPVDPRNTNAPIWAPFMEKFKPCAKQVMNTDDCQPYNYGIWRQSAMCHGEGKAIDVHGMKCGNTVHMALTSPQFEKVLLCIKQSGMKVIWKQCFMGCSPANHTNYHYDHGHFSIGCGMGRW